MGLAEERQRRVSVLLRSAEDEQHRAAHAAAIAVRHEEAILAGSSMSAHHEMMARVHRATERRHRTVADLHRAHALHLAGTDDQTSGPGDPFMAAIATLADAPSIGVSFGGGQGHLAGLASDDTTRAALRREVTLGEGPVHDCVTGGRLRVTGPLVEQRWPMYGRALCALRVGSVAAVPLEVSGTQAGALVVFDIEDRPRDLDQLDRIAEAFLDLMLADSRGTPLDTIVRSILDGIDHHPLIHQATGFLAHRLGCSVQEAGARLHARAFADGTDVDELARRLLEPDAPDLAGD